MLSKAELTSRPGRSAAIDITCKGGLLWQLSSRLLDMPTSTEVLRALRVSYDLANLQRGNLFAMKLNVKREPY